MYFDPILGSNLENIVRCLFQIFKYPQCVVSFDSRGLGCL